MLSTCAVCLDDYEELNDEMVCENCEEQEIKRLQNKVRQGISLFNAGSDNKEYLRGQIELSLFLLGQEDNKQLKLELERESK